MPLQDDCGGKLGNIYMSKPFSCFYCEKLFISFISREAFRNQLPGLHYLYGNPLKDSVFLCVTLL